MNYARFVTFFGDLSEYFEAVWKLEHLDLPHALKLFN